MKLIKQKRRRNLSQEISQEVLNLHRWSLYRSSGRMENYHNFNEKESNLS